MSLLYSVVYTKTVYEQIWHMSLLWLYGCFLFIIICIKLLQGPAFENLVLNK